MSWLFNEITYLESILLSSAIVFVYVYIMHKLEQKSRPHTKTASVYAIVDNFGKIYYTSAHEDSLHTNVIITKESSKHLNLQIIKLEGEYK